MSSTGMANNLSTVVDHVVGTSSPTAYLNGQAPSPQDPPHSILNTLPLEVWFCITEYLPLPSIAALALTNHFMYYCMQPLRPFERLRDQSNRAVLLLFLQQVEPSFPDYVICDVCLRFHKPQQMRLELPSLRRKWDSPRLPCKILKCPAWNDRYVKSPRINSCIFDSWARKWWLTFHLVMRAHRLGPKYGIPLSSIQQSKASDVVWYDERGPWKTDFCAVISDGKLLVRERLFMAVESSVWIDRRPNLPLGYRLIEGCRHNSYNRFQSWADEIRRMLRASERAGSQDLISSGELERCAHCPSEWQLHVIPKVAYDGVQATAQGELLLPRSYKPGFGSPRKDYLFLFVRYCDVGDCRSPIEPHWASLMDFSFYYWPRDLCADDTSIKSRFEAAL
jgi:hypothetical protein